MKNKLFFMALGAFLLLGLVGLASAFNAGATTTDATETAATKTSTTEAAATTTEAGAETIFDKSVGEYATFDYRKDTITNAAKDTLFVGNRASSAWNTVTTPANFLSLYTYDISIVRASLSGTHNQKVYLDKSDMRSGTSTDWQVIDSTSTTTATNATIRGTDATGARYRLRISGTGSQSSTYQIWSIWKKKN